MYHDFGASKWDLDGPEAFENFTKKANVTLLWKSESQDLGHEVIGNEANAPGVVGVRGESVMNIHVEYMVTKRIIGIPVEWRNQT